MKMRRRTRFGGLAVVRPAPLLLAILAGAVGCGFGASAAGTRSYPDPIGDQVVEASCGDIGGLAVSDTRGVIALTVSTKSFMCGELIVALDSNRDGHWDYDLGFRPNTNTRAAIDHFWPIAADDSIGTDVRWKVLSVWHHGASYTFRFRATALGVKRAFGFEAHLNGRYMSDVVDTAPDYPNDWFTYRLAGR